MLRRIACAFLFLLSGCDGCTRSSKPAPAAAPAPPEDFEPPGVDGFGQAAGLRYLERCLACPDVTAAVPMLVMIHGLGDAPRPDWFGGAEDIDAPLRLIMPQAPTPYYDGFAWFPFRVGDNDPDALAHGIAEAADRLDSAIAVLRQNRPTRGRPIVAGFSQGGMLSYALALRRPENVALSHPISGLLPKPLWPKEKPKSGHVPPIRAVHGDADEIVPISPDRELVEHLRGLGYDVQLREYPGIGHTVTPEMDQFTVELVNRTIRELTFRPVIAPPTPSSR